MTFKKKGLALIGTALIVVCLKALPSDAQPSPGFHGPRGGMMGGGMMLPLLLRAANLTADQKTQVQQIMANHRATLHDLFSQLRTVQDQMSTKLFSAGAVGEADLAPQTQQISSLRNQLAEEGLKVVLEIRNILTPDQLAKASQVKAQMESLRSQMKNLMPPRQGEQ